jgi:hypothetical protein
MCFIRAAEIVTGQLNALDNLSSADRLPLSVRAKRNLLKLAISRRTRAIQLIPRVQQGITVKEEALCFVE